MKSSKDCLFIQIGFYFSLLTPYKLKFEFNLVRIQVNQGLS